MLDAASLRRCVPASSSRSIGQQLALNLPVVPIRPLSAYALVQQAML